MNKAELIEKLAKQVGTTKADAERVLKATIEIISNELSKGRSVAIAGFGTFEARKRKARTARNPRTGEEIKVPAKRVPAFKAAKALKDAVA